MKLKTNLPQTFNSSFCYTDDVLDSVIIYITSI